MKGRSLKYSQAELAWIEANAALPAPLLHIRFGEEFGRADVSKANLVALRKRRGWRASGDGRFRPGHATWNHGAIGFCPSGSERGWFRPGERTGFAARLYKPVGTERVSKNGYLERKINDDKPEHKRWRAVHLIEWEAVNGPLPRGMALKCLDGNRRNTAAANWEAVPRAMLPALAGGNGRGAPILAYDHAPPELRPAVMAIAKIKHAIARKSEAAE